MAQVLDAANADGTMLDSFIMLTLPSVFSGVNPKAHQVVKTESPEAALILRDRTNRKTIDRYAAMVGEAFGILRANGLLRRETYYDEPSGAFVFGPAFVPTQKAVRLKGEEKLDALLAELA